MHIPRPNIFSAWIMYINKYILSSALLTSAIAFSFPVSAQSSQCLNFWINPKTGQEECLDNFNKKTSSSPYPGLVLLTESVQGVRTYIQEKIQIINGKASHRKIAVDAVGNTLEARAIADCRTGGMATKSEVLRSPQGIVLKRTIIRVPLYYPMRPGSTGMAEWEYACSRNQSN